MANISGGFAPLDGIVQVTDEDGTVRTINLALMTDAQYEPKYKSPWANEKEKAPEARLQIFFPVPVDGQAHYIDFRGALATAIQGLIDQTVRARVRLVRDDDEA